MKWWVGWGWIGTFLLFELFRLLIIFIWIFRIVDLSLNIGNFLVALLLILIRFLVVTCQIFFVCLRNILVSIVNKNFINMIFFIFWPNFKFFQMLPIWINILSFLNVNLLSVLDFFLVFRIIIFLLWFYVIFFILKFCLFIFSIRLLRFLWFLFDRFNGIHINLFGIFRTIISGRIFVFVLVYLIILLKYIWHFFCIVGFVINLFFIIYFLSCHFWEWFFYKGLLCHL